jgi:hypothetical protein
MDAGHGEATVRVHRSGVAVLVTAGLLGACSGSSPGPAVSSGVTSGASTTPATTAASTSAATSGANATSAPPTTSGTSVPPTTGASPAEPYVSASYRYTVTSTDWTGTDARQRWDGGSPGDADPTVDVLHGPEGEQAYAFGEPTSQTLRQFVASARAANAKAHPCTKEVPSSTTTTVGGAPAVLDQGHCPPPGGPFVMTAYVVHGGRAYVFFTYSIPPGSEHFTRHWFVQVRSEISFPR